MQPQHFDPMPYTVPAWHGQAKCSGTTTPQTYDTQPGRDTPRWRKLVDAQLACYACPVARECAREAIEVHAVGVVRAGIPLADSRHRAETRALAAVADGVEPVEVGLNLAWSTDHGLRPASGPLSVLSGRDEVDTRPGDVRTAAARLAVV